MGKVIKTGAYPCGVCSKGVGSNSIQCTSCKAWIHKRCSGISGMLQKVRNYRRRKCVDGSQPEMKREISLGADGKLECVEEFRYLGDVIGAGGGAEEASRARVRCAWAKFRSLAPVLTVRGASLKKKGKVYETCVQEFWCMELKRGQ